MLNFFHTSDAALRGTRIPRISNSSGLDQNQDQDQMGEEEKNKEDTLGNLMTNIREEVEMSLEGVRRKLNGVKEILGMMESLCRGALGEELEGRVEDGEDEGDEGDEGEEVEEEEEEEEEEMNEEEEMERWYWIS
ncbi:uncharacterized protein EAF02_010594 [Botrytis sinoallii]|uniref:uncharacterized protein n=1 Tax=Botrytis sinoallii TaxID=1463999 RepID=UPI0019027A3B|nr:uncharacterized protein EAF02_010594 [Botrytis sinoallii]KAF7861640.1 hypothetical protein EAF02_010594 [Botrytis sinoallii]